MPSLYGVLEKRDRAVHHLKAIERTIREFLSRNTYMVETKGDPEHGVYHAHLVYPSQLPTSQLGVMIGDCVHNMRSALDYIAWELAGGDIKDIYTQFPIHKTSEGFSKGRERIARLPLEAQAEIERLQPYHTEGGGDQLALLAIHKIDNADKHKLLTVAAVMPSEIDCNFRPFRPQGGDQKITIYRHERLVHDAKVATYTIFPPVPDVEVRFKFTPEVMFYKIEGFHDFHYVIPNLGKMIESVNEVIKRMTPFFNTDKFLQ